MISLFMPVILCFTVVVSVSFGVVAAYAMVIGILQAFAFSRESNSDPVMSGRAWCWFQRNRTPAVTESAVPQRSSSIHFSASTL